jgi:hypothetical protein
MIRRLTIMLVAALLAVTPAMRAMCDVSCVTTAHHARHAIVANHCSPAPVEHSTPAPDDSCRHEHAHAAPLVLTAKVTVAPITLIAAAPAPQGIPAFRWSVVASASATSSPPLHSAFPVPLRI